MAMEQVQLIKDTHNKPITAVGYNPIKHEILAGFEDGVIKAWDYSTGETGKSVRSMHEHQGFVTAFLLWFDAKFMLSSGNDGTIIAWGSGGAVYDQINIGTPIYGMAWHSRRNQLIVCAGMTVQLFSMKDPGKELGHVIDTKAFITREHTDIVRCIAALETRVYSAGFDRSIIVYESLSYPGAKGIKMATCIKDAHDAGITCLSVTRDSDNNTWLSSGSFDKTVKLWTPDGQMIHKFDGFSSVITGLVYVRPANTIWVTAGTTEAAMYDPKSGENVSDFAGTFRVSNETFTLELLAFIPVLGQVIGTNIRRQVIMWKFNPSGCLTTLRHNCPVESLAYTPKVPLLIFSGGSDGNVTKWERLQASNFIYSKEIFARSEGLACLARQFAEKYEKISGRSEQKRAVTRARHCSSLESVKPKAKSYGITDFTEDVSILNSLFVESLDLLVLSSEDNNIYVWGFDKKAVDVLKNMKPTDEFLNQRYAILLDSAGCVPEADQEISKENVDSVTNRVAGFICQCVLSEHSSCITGIVAVEKSPRRRYETTFLISAGWDRKILIWDLEKLCLHDVFHSKSSINGKTSCPELAADGMIMDLAYSPERDEFAYAATDKLVYIRKFSDNGSEMKLTGVLQGHEEDVTQVKWNAVISKWVTGSDDGSIRIWSDDAMQCDQHVSIHGTITSLCIDEANGCIALGVQDKIRIYDPDSRKFVKTYVGHSDSVRSIIHIPERGQYITSSWDATVRIWSAYKKKIK
ncbi:uncharacterized WD repeat-containing protein alr3466-like [Xenia sp. Carnegie-2017]|uniref:uncharacterized WD repeat-containing protein alr3466-like n=1 Tax=Xenia sp. Carnegie-2017 TaxID=2897299 RepID=UPI001F042793|nr:uncharacterized WD repeat-containing protein alr3466-like [Xenia sp. Carnegie-2017]